MTSDKNYIALPWDDGMSGEELERFARAEEEYDAWLDAQRTLDDEPIVQL